MANPRAVRHQFLWLMCIRPGGPGGQLWCLDNRRREYLNRTNRLRHYGATALGVEALGTGCCLLIGEKSGPSFAQKVHFGSALPNLAAERAQTYKSLKRLTRSISCSTTFSVKRRSSSSCIKLLDKRVPFFHPTCFFHPRAPVPTRTKFARYLCDATGGNHECSCLGGEATSDSGASCCERSASG